MSKVEKVYTEEDMIKMDCRENFISFSNRDLFYDVFSERLDILKLFILNQLELDIEEDDCTIQLNNMDIKDIDLDDVMKIRIYVNNINVKLFIKKECINKRQDLYDNILILIKLYLNDKLTPGGYKIRNGFEKIVIPENIEKKVLNNYALVIYPEYYRNLYFYERQDLNKKELWYVMLACKNFQELYIMSEKIIDKDMLNIFINSVVDKCRKINKKEEDIQRRKRNEYESRLWEIEKEEYDKGMKKGTNGTINKCIIRMLKENLDLELISRITNKDTDYINGFKKIIAMINKNIDIEEISRIMGISIEFIDTLKRIYFR